MTEAEELAELKKVNQEKLAAESKKVEQEKLAAESERVKQEELTTELKRVKDAIDVVTKLKTLKAEARESLHIDDSDSKKEAERAKRYFEICDKIEKFEKIFTEP